MALHRKRLVIFFYPDERTKLSEQADLARLFADPTRVRLLHLLEREELTVAELTHITRVAQSRVSTRIR